MAPLARAADAAAKPKPKVGRPNRVWRWDARVGHGDVSAWRKDRRPVAPRASNYVMPRPSSRPGAPKHYVFAFRPPTQLFKMKLSFARNRVTRDEVIDALAQILRELRKAK
jgi:hypothetical protein